MTSEVNVDEGAPAETAPRMPWSWSITRNTGELPWRTTSPHETVAAASAASPISRMELRMSSALDDARGDEDEELRVRLIDSVPLEQPLDDRHVAQPGRLVDRVGRAARIDAADDRRLAVADQHLGVGALGVDRARAI